MDCCCWWWWCHHEFEPMIFDYHCVIYNSPIFSISNEVIVLVVHLQDFNLDFINCYSLKKYFYAGFWNWRSQARAHKWGIWFTRWSNNYGKIMCKTQLYKINVVFRLHHIDQMNMASTYPARVCLQFVCICPNKIKDMFL